MVKAKITPTETFRRAVKRNSEPLPTLEEKLPTSFREPYSFSLPCELTALLKQLNKHINVSREAEPLIKAWAVKIAREINENRK